MSEPRVAVRGSQKGGDSENETILRSHAQNSTQTYRHADCAIEDSPLGSTPSGSASTSAIAVTPPTPILEHPPGFAQTEFETIIRRHRPIPSHGLKIAHNYGASSPQLDADWQFAGWGSVSYLEITEQELYDANKRLSVPRATQLGQFRGTAIAGNGVYGSVFYAFPAVAATSSIFSPFSLLVACLLLFLFRPLLLDLGRSARMNGANYTYLLQFSGKILGVLGAAATLFDAVATSAVSAATASAYLAGEFAHFPIKESILAICILLSLTAVSFFGMRESSGLALSFTIVHLTVMLLLFVASLIGWVRFGSGTFGMNWSRRPSNPSGVVSAIFRGICLSFLSTTGFECTPAYIEDIRSDAYGPVLRNLLCGALILNAPLMLLVYALLPEKDILSGSNVLSLLAERVGGPWLRVIVVIDAMLVLSGGVLTGIFTVCGLLERLAHDNVLPRIFLQKIPVTNAPYPALMSFIVLSIALYASCGFSLSIASSLFSLSFIFVMGLYILSSLLLRFRRSRLLRPPSPLRIQLAATVVIVTVFVGNIVPSPRIFGLFIAYLCAVAAGLSARTYELELLRLLMKIYEHTHTLHRYSLDRVLIKRIRHLQRLPVYAWVKTDNIHSLLEACLYVRRNEATSRMVFIHAYEALDRIPSELEANCKILDEAFPAMTVDLAFLKGSFSPALAEAVSVKVKVPLSSCFMFSPSEQKEWGLASYGGIRVIR